MNTRSARALRQELRQLLDAVQPENQPEGRILEFHQAVERHLDGHPIYKQAGFSEIPLHPYFSSRGKTADGVFHPPYKEKDDFYRKRLWHAAREISPHTPTFADVHRRGRGRPGRVLEQARKRRGSDSEHDYDSTGKPTPALRVFADDSGRAWRRRETEIRWNSIAAWRKD